MARLCLPAFTAGVLFVCSAEKKFTAINTFRRFSGVIEVPLRWQAWRGGLAREQGVPGQPAVIVGRG
jgi:hypothetical protein